MSISASFDPSTIRDRIIRVERVPAESLVPCPDNWRVHTPAQREAFREVLATVGAAGVVLTRELEDGRLMLIDGHMRAEELAGTEVWAAVTDLSEEEAEWLLAVYDPISQMAEVRDESARALIARAREAGRDGIANILSTHMDTSRALASLARDYGTPGMPGMSGTTGMGTLGRWERAGGDPYLEEEEEEDEYPGVDATHGAPDHRPTGGTDRAGDGFGGLSDREPGVARDLDQRAGANEEAPREDKAGTLDSVRGYVDHSARGANLVQRFGVPPFSLLDTRQQYWIERRRAWLSLGIESEVGRDTTGPNVRFGRGAAMKTTLTTADKDFEAGEGHEKPAVSIFDPVLAELAVRWWCPPGGAVLDPFAGGSVRGIVTARTGRGYYGLDLRPEQVAANHAQWARIGGASAPRPATLIQWMSRLYQISADLRNLRGDIGTWPVELGPYIEGLCFAHASEACTFSTLPGLLLRLPGDSPFTGEKPRRGKVALIIFSGGKDSIASALRAQRAGYEPHCVYVRRVNKSFPQEGPNAEAICAAMGWEFTGITPDDLPDTWAESMVKNHYCMALALHTLDYIPGAYGFGNYQYEDGVITTGYHDMLASYDRWDHMLQRTYPMERLPALRDEVEAYTWWEKHTNDEVKHLTTSCVMPPRFKPQHQRRCLEQGVPLWNYECGICEKCSTKALVYATHFPDVARYSGDYLSACRKRIAAYGTEAPEFSHAHPALISWRHTNEEGRALNSAEYFYDVVCGGVICDDPPKMRAKPVTWIERQEPPRLINDHEEYTPFERRGGVWVKRDDLFQPVPGVCGAKARVAWAMLKEARAEGCEDVVTVGGNDSAQLGIVAALASFFDARAYLVHPAASEQSESLSRAISMGGEKTELVPISPGHTNVIKARARELAKAKHAALIPYGLEDERTVRYNRDQVRNLPPGIRRILVPVGGGMTLAGILWGLRDLKWEGEVIGVTVGSEVKKRLDQYAPPDWEQSVTLLPYTSLDYRQPLEGDECEWNGLTLDGWYEAKLVRLVPPEPGDCVWIAGNHVPPTSGGERAPIWREGDARHLLDTFPDVPDGSVDMILTCPPYYDLERYSEDPRDLANCRTYSQFVGDMGDILTQCAQKLADHRFAVMVLGEARDDRGLLRGIIPDIVAAANAAGLRYYNDAIVLNSAGSLPVRAGRTFRLGRKLGRQHQYLLVFCKGDPKLATQACGEVEMGTLDALAAEAANIAARKKSEHELRAARALYLAEEGMEGEVEEPDEEDYLPLGEDDNPTGPEHALRERRGSSPGLAPRSALPPSEDDEEDVLWEDEEEEDEEGGAPAREYRLAGTDRFDADEDGEEGA